MEEREAPVIYGGPWPAREVERDMEIYAQASSDAPRAALKQLEDSRMGDRFL
jgi:hypothetical protein